MFITAAHVGRRGEDEGKNVEKRDEMNKSGILSNNRKTSCRATMRFQVCWKHASILMKFFVLSHLLTESTQLVKVR